MGGSRTVKTLAVLFVAMTLGALALMLLEPQPVQPDPVRPTPPALAVLSSPPAGATQLIRQTQAPLQPAKWRTVVLHAARDESAGPAKGCHFVVASDANGGWKISPTDHWIRQDSGAHVEGDWKDRGSVGICLIGDFSRTPPKPAQFDLLVQLVNALQQICHVSADRVYLYSDIDSRSSSPGAAFPAGKLSDRLLRPM